MRILPLQCPMAFIIKQEYNLAYKLSWCWLATGFARILLALNKAPKIFICARSSHRLLVDVIFPNLSWSLLHISWIYWSLSLSSKSLFVPFIVLGYSPRVLIFVRVSSSSSYLDFLHSSSCRSSSTKYSKASSSSISHLWTGELT